MSSVDNGGQEFSRLVQQSVEEGTFVKCTLSENKGPEKELTTVFLRLVELKRGVFMQCLFRYKTNDQVKNYPISEVRETVNTLLGKGFDQASLFTTTADYRMKNRKLEKLPGEPAFKEAVVEGHDRKKIVPIQETADFLQALGVSNAQGKPRPGMADKLRQVFFLSAFVCIWVCVCVRAFVEACEASDRSFTSYRRESYLCVCLHVRAGCICFFRTMLL